MQRYELVEGGSSKFWQVEVSGPDLTVLFGRIGTAGQRKTKTLSDAAAATRERDKLIKEKTGKGYALVSSLPTQQPVQKPAEAVPVATANVAQASIASVPSSPAAPKPDVLARDNAPLAQPQLIIWPSGGFQWKKEWRDALPIVRGIHAPPLEPVSTLLEKLIVLPGGNNWMAQSFAALTQAAGRPWVYWSEAESRQRITREALDQADFEYWLELMAQASCSNWQHHSLRWVTQVCIGLHGLPFAMEVALNFWAPALTRRSDMSDLLEPLRQAVACANEADYALALQAALVLREQSFEKKRVCAHLFAHLGDWATQCLDQQAQDDRMLLKDCALSAPRFLQYIQTNRTHISYLRPALYLQIHLHGEAAFDVLACVLSQSTGSKATAVEALELLVRMHVPALLPLLVSGIENHETRHALEKLVPQYSAAVLKSAIDYSASSRNSTVEGWTVRLALREADALKTALAAVEPDVRSRFEARLASLQGEQAPAASLPEVLRNPPWLGKQRQQDLPAFEVATLPTPEIMNWTAQELAQARRYEVRAYLRQPGFTDGFPNDLAIHAAGVQRLLAGQGLLPGDVATRSYNYQSPNLLLVVPEKYRLALWNSYPVNQWCLWDSNEGAIRLLLADYGLAALPGVLACLQFSPEKGLPLIERIDSPQLVDAVLHIASNLKKARAQAQLWLRDHPRTVLFKALPAAFHPKPSPSRDNARHGIRWLCSNGFDVLAREVAQAYGGAMPAALEALIHVNPLLVLPGKMPKLPTFFVPGALRRPELRESGLALPASAVEHIASMLTISPLEAPYPGLQIVKEVCTPASLAEFAWDVFDAWTTAGSPSKEGWAFTALGLLGDDETARRLAPRIRLWPGESAHARAVTGLDLLAAIGTDVALMHLNAIAGKVKFKALQERAKEKISAVAEARGFTAEALADRLVPDLGLDDTGTLVLDFGQRRFFVGFDETLKPLVKDAQGVRLKDLPKPLKSDDATLAEAATASFKQIKKDAKAIASQQVSRLEMAMVARRRWPVADFKLFFIEHPLMRHLAARLVWGVYEAGKLVSNFRVAEDWSLADADDTLYELPEQTENSSVGISHILEMPKTNLAAFGQIFADYEILQPFKQLGRETYSLTAEEQGLSTLTRFKDKQVATGSVLGLVNRGWERGQAQDGGWVGEFSKLIEGHLQVDVQLDPGTTVGDISCEPKQKLPAVTLMRRGSHDPNSLLTFDQLHPVVISEILRDLELLAVVKD
ncbi:MAG: DUF4132 domain-containing protein [Polaromonas sp.]|nr:MAG: DUF4132 domain-containing protein [Polaromonas sp.]